MKHNLVFSIFRNKLVLLGIVLGVFISLLSYKLESKPQTYFRKAPYLIFTKSNRQMELLWQNYSSQNCKISLRNMATDKKSVYTSIEGNADHQHYMIFDSLDYATLYHYEVDCGNEIKKGSFRSRPQDTMSTFSFFAYGDTRTYPSHHNLVAEQIMKIVKSRPLTQTFVAATGDLVADGDKEQDWDKQFFDPQYKYIQLMLANLPYMSAMGNHEGQGILFAKYFPYNFYEKDENFYSFNYGNVHFIAIDQFTNLEKDSPQYRWFEKNLKDSKAHWKIVLMHKPGWTAGGHSNDTLVQKLLQPLFVKYNVKLVLTGHNHYYARAVVDGINEITTGGGGAPLYFPKMKENIVIIDRSNHFCTIDVNADSLVVSAIRSDGSLIEKFAIKH